MKYSWINLLGIFLSIGCSVAIIDLLDGSWESIVGTSFIFIGGCLWMIPTRTTNA